MNIVVLEPATAEAQEAEEWYGNESENAAKRFRTELLEHLDWIKSSPQLFPLIRKKYRRSILKVFPYSVIYVTTTSTIYVVAIAHHSRKPNYWRSRQIPE